MTKKRNFKLVSEHSGFIEHDIADVDDRNIITVKQVSANDIHKPTTSGYDDNPFNPTKPERVTDNETKKYIKSHTMLKFFKYEKGEFAINREELLLIPSARKIITSDKGGTLKGDSDGRKKLWSEKQFGLAWWCIDINSPGIQAGLEGSELFEDAYAALEIPKDWDYSKDSIFMAFYYDYQEMYEKASYAALLKQLLMSLNDTAVIVKIIRDNSTKLLKANRDLDATDISALLSGQKELINLAGDVPKHIDKLKALQAMVRKEERDLEAGRGGVIITQSMNPDDV